jgi:hypothetical protein
MLYPLRSFLEQRRDDDDFFSPRQLSQAVRARPWDGFSQFKITMILALAKVARAKQLL